MALIALAGCWPAGKICCFLYLHNICLPCIAASFGSCCTKDRRITHVWLYSCVALLMCGFLHQLHQKSNSPPPTCWPSRPCNNQQYRQSAEILVRHWCQVHQDTTRALCQPFVKQS
jgi:hypothetical protein